MMELRPYQQKAIDMLYDWFRENKAGNPVLCMPGGSGKSVIIAELVRGALKSWPKTRVLMLVHSKELIAQNADKLRKLWPCAPLGIYSASIGKRQLGRQITYAGIGSVAKRAKQIGHIDLCIIDEAHSVSVGESGIYRKLLSDLTAINPAMRVVGFTASPYRLGQGMITDGDSAIFSDILEPVTILDLVNDGYLAPLRSKVTSHRLDTNGIHKRQGEYMASEVEERFNTSDHNSAVVDEIMRIATDRKHWLIFCSGVAHSEAVAECFRASGIAAESLDASHSKTERERKLAEFESGRIKALCNVGILSTGYDLPALDCIAFLRPTMSPGLYLQMAVRGMRIVEGKKDKDCLVLDFVGNVSKHGPVTDITPPKKGGKGGGDAPVKTCPDCSEIVPASAKACPACGHLFPGVEKQPPRLHNDDIMGIEPQEMACISWKWSVQKSRNSGIDMLVCKHYGALSDPSITEYFCIMHPGYPGRVAFRALMDLASHAGIADSDKMLSLSLDTLAGAMNGANPPSKVRYKKEGKFFKVISRSW